MQRGPDERLPIFRFEPVQVRTEVRALTKAVGSRLASRGKETSGPRTTPLVFNAYPYGRIMVTDGCKGLLGKGIGIAVVEFKGMVVSVIEGAGGASIAA